MHLLINIFITIARIICFFNSRNGFKYDYIIVRRDRIGDFILWLGCAQKFRQLNEKSTICLICSSYNYEIAKISRIFDNIIIIDDKFTDIRKVFGLSCNKLFMPRRSRSFKDELIATTTYAKKKVAVQNDQVYTISVIDEYKLYDEVVDIPLCETPELEINTLFLNKSLNKYYNNLYADLSYISSDRIIAEEYFVVNLGSSSGYKNWSTDNFIDLIERVNTNKPLLCILVGGISEVDNSNYFVEKYSGRVANMAGKTTIPDLISLISYSCYVISNDTSVVHISAACDIKCFYICSGVHYGRFSRYPEEDIEFRKNLPISITDDIRSCFGCQLYREKFYDLNKECRKALNNNKQLPCISNISVEKAYKLIMDNI